jgi:hypothetical protein
MFGVATGWLGWPPETAWRSTVQEILVALEARMEMQRASTPSVKSQKQDDEPKPVGSLIDAIKKLPGTKVYGRE